MKTKLITFSLISIFMVACQNESDFSDNSIVEKNSKKLHQQYLHVQNVYAETFTPQELRILEKASARFSNYLIFNENGTISINGKTAVDLNMDQKLFDYNYTVIDGWNKGNYDFKSISIKNPMTRSVGEESGGGNTGTRGGTVARDLAAYAISSVLSTGGWTTAKKYFDMWYFDNRSSDYSMSSSEWNDASSYADTYVGISYQKNPTQIQGSTYYLNSVSYGDASNDLFLSYGTASVFFDTSGDPAGFYDFYDFNEGNRGSFQEWMLDRIREIGDDQGYCIVYGQETH